MINSTNTGTEKKIVERLTIVVTGKGIEKTLLIPKLESGKFLCQCAYFNKLKLSKRLS